jgi:hypothetical protein
VSPECIDGRDCRENIASFDCPQLPTNAVTAHLSPEFFGLDNWNVRLRSNGLFGNKEVQYDSSDP